MPKLLKNNLIIATRIDSKYIPHLTDENIQAYLSYLKSLNPKEVVCITSQDEPFLDIITKTSDKVLNYINFSYKEPIEMAYKYAQEYYLLIISFGVELQSWQMLHGFNYLKSRNLLCLGWRILQQENDGSYIGKLAYNTCMLHAPGFYENVLAVNGIPSYVENGTLGTLKINIDNKVREVQIGGQEELALQLKIFKELSNKKHKLFGLIKHYGLEYLTQKLPSDGFNEKIVRKVVTAEVYRKTEEINPTEFLDSWDIL